MTSRATLCLRPAGHSSRRLLRCIDTRTETEKDANEPCAAVLAERRSQVIYVQSHAAQCVSQQAVCNAGEHCSWSGPPVCIELPTEMAGCVVVEATLYVEQKSVLFAALDLNGLMHCFEIRCRCGPLAKCTAVLEACSCADESVTCSGAYGRCMLCYPKQVLDLGPLL